MVALTHVFPAKDKIAAKDVSRHIRTVLKRTGVSERTIAQGLAIGETYFSRMKNRQTGFYRRESLYSIERLLQVVEYAKTTLSEKGVRDWLIEPNAYLNNVPPILCLRSDEEMAKVISLLGAIRYGIPS